MGGTATAHKQKIIKGKNIRLNLINKILHVNKYYWLCLAQERYSWGSGRKYNLSIAHWWWWGGEEGRNQSEYATRCPVLKKMTTTQFLNALHTDGNGG
jgi:hypothetical protein